MKKQPKQKRSLLMVESILEASTQLLSVTPLKFMTTNKVADVAGVSIGSLYEYFPNKNSIVLALMDNRMQKQLDEFYSTLEKHNSMEALIETILDMIEHDYLKQKKLLHELFSLAPENGRTEVLFLNRIKAQKALEKFMIEKMGKSQEWAELKSFIAVNAVLGTVETYIFVDEAKITHADFRKEMAVLMRAVLEMS